MKLANSTELATVLAALRTYPVQMALNGECPPADVEDIATDGGRLTPLDRDQIDDLCARLNGGG